MKNFNKFSFDKFLESRDKSLYREVRITSDIKTHTDAAKTQMWEEVTKIRKHIIKLIGSDDEKLNIHSHPSLKFLAFPGYGGDQQQQENLKSTIDLLKSAHEMFLSDWDSLSDASKNESLFSINDAMNKLFSSEYFPVTTPVYNLKIQRGNTDAGHLVKRDYVEKLNKHIIDPLTDIEKALDEWIAKNKPESPAQQAAPAVMPNKQAAPAVMQNKQDAPTEMPNKKDAPAVMPKQGWLSKMFSK